MLSQHPGERLGVVCRSEPLAQGVEAATRDLNANPAIGDKEPLRAGVRVPVRSTTVRECHSIHAHGLFMDEALDFQAAERGCRIAGAGCRVT